MKYYIEILTCDGGWITYAVRDDYESAVRIRNMMGSVHNYYQPQIRIVS